jgi:hypothetical protein
VNTANEPVTITDIADLTAWLRRISADQPNATDPAELAAFHTAKADLLARIHNQHTQAARRPNPGKDDDD